MAELQPYKGEYYLWQYVPSLAAAVIFLIFFLATTLFHFWKIWKTRAQFCLVFAVGGLFEVIGFGARASAHDRTASLMPYCIQNVFILLEPTLFAATVYMILGRIIRSIHAEQYSIVRVKWLTKIFVMGDVFSFLIQGTAGVLMASGGNASLGQDIVIAGLVIQVVMFALFIITAVIFQMRMRQYPTRQAFDDDLPWKQHLYTLYTVSLLIMARSIFRVAEYAMGHNGYPLTHEWTLYVFDALLVFVVMVIYGVFFPSKLQLRREKGKEGHIGHEDSRERLSSDLDSVVFTMHCSLVSISPVCYALLSTAMRYEYESIFSPHLPFLSLSLLLLLLLLLHRYHFLY